MVKQSINYQKRDSYYTCNKTLKSTCMKPSTPAMFFPILKKVKEAMLQELRQRIRKFLLHPLPHPLFAP